ncbi:hypothetical protein INR49_012751 [Caranx melampygus]|nr:hypothetical protein INR49_012751 [Caranx melampygus]
MRSITYSEKWGTLIVHVLLPALQHGTLEMVSKDPLRRTLEGERDGFFQPVALLCCAACPVVSCVLRPTVLRFSHVVSVCHCPRGIGLTA